MQLVASQSIWANPETHCPDKTWEEPQTTSQNQSTNQSILLRISCYWLSCRRDEFRDRVIGHDFLLSRISSLDFIRSDTTESFIYISLVSNNFLLEQTRVRRHFFCSLAFSAFDVSSRSLQLYIQASANNRIWRIKIDVFILLGKASVSQFP